MIKRSVLYCTYMNIFFQMFWSLCSTIKSIHLQNHNQQDNNPRHILHFMQKYFQKFVSIFCLKLMKFLRSRKIHVAFKISYASTWNTNVSVICLLLIHISITRGKALLCNMWSGSFFNCFSQFQFLEINIFMFHKHMFMMHTEGNNCFKVDFVSKFGSLLF